MDIGAIIGAIFGVTMILIGYILEGGSLGSLVAPSPLFIVIGGTIGCMLLAFPLPELKKLIGSLKTIFTSKNYNEIEIINKLAELSEKARKDGLLSLEQDAQNNDNPLIRKGLALVVDGIETEVIKDILIREAELHESIHESGAKMLEAAGGFSPTMGVLGTVMGMIVILGNMEDPGELGHKIAVAFIATMLGVGLANLIYLPMAARIKTKAERDKMISDLIIEGLLSIQAGENPRIIKEKLNLALLEKMYKKGGSKQDSKDEGEG
ncbi:MAG: flagellar motor protein [Clostridia bacterium]|nr:flagellar motor protein [Clostridia bacterium]